MTADSTPLIPAENIYGHVQRLNWLRDRLRPEERVLEFGCGTGRLITLPLRSWGYRVEGIDLDSVSIEYGRRLLEQAGLDPDVLTTTDLRDVDGPLDAVIASEVLEHLNDADLGDSLALIRAKLAPQGRLLVTVPNGYSEFELENFLWERAGVGRLYDRVSRGALADSARRMKARRSDWERDAVPMTVADSPHLQRFTWRSMHRTLTRAGFDVVEARGAILVCGPFTDIVLSGVPAAMELNKRLGKRFGRLASDFYVVATRR